MALVRAGTFVIYSFTNDRGLLVDRGAWLVTDSSNAGSNPADLKFTKYPDDYGPEGAGPCTVFAAAVPEGTGEAGTWNEPVSPPYT